MFAYSSRHLHSYWYLFYFINLLNYFLFVYFWFQGIEMGQKIAEICDRIETFRYSKPVLLQVIFESLTQLNFLTFIFFSH